MTETGGRWRPLAETKPGKPVACNYGLLWLIYGLLWGLVACCFRLLGVPGTFFVSGLPAEEFTGSTMVASVDPIIFTGELFEV